MSDITMCSNKDCELKEGCFRFTAIPNKYRQSYLANPKDECENKSHELFVDYND